MTWPTPIWRRAAIVWMLFMLVETGNGAVREVFVAPRIGGLLARQLGVLAGSSIIFLIALSTARWVNAATRREHMSVGAFWVALTVVFEFSLGRAMDLSWHTILADYDPLRGGLMLLGLAFMFATPWLTRFRLKEES